MEVTPEVHERYKDEYDKAYRAADYSVKRIDILLITISMGGILFNFQILTWILENNFCNCFSLNLISIMFFGLCIITNLIGQYCSYKGHEYYVQYYKEQLNNNAGIHMEEEDNKEIDYSAAIKLANIGCLIFISIATLTSFLSITFSV